MLYWQLRLALSLAGARLKQNRPREARQVLEAVYGRFAEGLDTPDLGSALAIFAIGSIAVVGAHALRPAFATADRDPERSSSAKGKTTARRTRTLEGRYTGWIASVLVSVAMSTFAAGPDEAGF